MDEPPSESPTVASPLPSVAGLVAGRYQVRSRLGRGATKEVYLAYDERLDRDVALAVVIGAGDDVARARVAREAQVTGRLGDHPNIITIYDTGEIDGVAFLVMRAMSGGSLADLLARERPPLEHTIRVCREIALALSHAHAHGVVHRDVKPDNVWLAADGSAALGDFGIAHREGSDRLTAEGMVLGTVRYLSPEQIRGAEVGPASDLYALGVTLYELVCGRPPFVAADPMQVLTQHMTAQPVPPSEHTPGVPEALELLILAMLAKAPQERPASAADVARALGTIAAADSEKTLGELPALAPERQARRFVTVLAASAAIDPEAMHAAFERCTAAVERHGGTVERYFGDVVVGFYGLTESHGDDALRASRAALELRSEVPELRLGIESGELFIAGGGAVPTGAAIKAAVRLAESAPAGEIILGERVRRAVGPGAAVDAATGRLLELQTEQPGVLRDSHTLFVGRSHELEELRGAFARVREERACRLVTVAGPPGIGKSRLAHEFLDAVRSDATVLAGRCLAYGEGTTYRALLDIVHGLGDDPRGEVERLLAGDEQAIRGILGAVGLSDEAAQAEETSWAMRRLLERLAADRPVVVAVEDIHWADPALLAGLDHLVALSSGSPILLLCLTRPDLLESRPEWGAPQPNRSVLVLDALGAEQARQLAESLGAGESAGRIAERAEGNPLFVEQLVAVDAEQDDGELPASIHVVLATRIDALEVDERTVLQRAAVEGRAFHAGALESLLPERERRGVSAILVALARKGLIAADRSEFVGEDAFRFKHALIREAAYAGVPKLLRAELHAAVAAWLEQRAVDEIVGFHLERACLLRRELGAGGDIERGLATRAAAHLEAASRLAMTRGNAPAASSLLERAVAILGSDEAARAALLPALGASMFEAGRLTEATGVLDEAIARAPAPGVEARARIEREFVRLETETVGIEQSLVVADAALPVLELDGDVAGQGRVWSLRAQVAWVGGNVGTADAAWCEAAEWARRTGDERDLFNVLRWRGTAAVLGPTPVSEAIAMCEEFRGAVSASPAAVAWTDNALAVLHAMRGEQARAESYIADANKTLGELGGMSALVSHHEALVRLLTGRPDLAERTLRRGVERLAPLGDVGLLATTTAMLAQAVYAQHRPAEAADLCDATATTAARDDIITQVIWRGVKAKALAGDGRCEEGEALAREAIALVKPTDLLSHHGDALLDLAEVLRACSRPDDGRDAAALGLALYESKGNAAGGARARAIIGDPPAVGRQQG